MGKTYDVYFDFTTAHGAGRFVGRSGQINISTYADIDDVYRDLETIQQMCADVVHAEKPKWNIFMINIKEIKLVTADKQNKK